jgi:hypothetical protein
MPIRINLLAEAQALEDLRRRDPVKRAIWVAGFLVCMTLAFSSYLQLRATIAKGDLNRVEGQLASRTNEYRSVLDNQTKLAEVNHKLGALQQLATNRLLYGTLLNALQQTTIDEVQLTRFRVDQSYALTEAVRPKTNEDNRITAGKPATSTERVVLTLEARDTGPNPGDQVNRFKQSLTNSPYFQAVLSKTNEVRLTSLSAPQMVDAKASVSFSLECRYPERTR